MSFDQIFIVFERQFFGKTQSPPMTFFIAEKSHLGINSTISQQYAYK